MRAMKDMAVSRGLMQYAQSAIGRYGTIKDLKLNSAERTVDVTVLLKGENDPIHVTVESYSVRKADGKNYIRVDATHCSRAWIQALMEDHLVGREYELPAGAGMFL
jgi:hypothetical protein